MTRKIFSSILSVSVIVLLYKRQAVSDKHLRDPVWIFWKCH